MKTLAVLAALAAIAAAVPALPGYNYGYRPAHYRLPVSFRREKKSPPLVSDVIPAVEMQQQLDTTPEARTFLKKKPIIVKKNYGYHLYRDSDEEMAARSDPTEKCNKEVKVKLCDAESLPRMRSADEDNNAPLTENEMKNSIKMAKEAVENLQKITHIKKDAGADAEIHDDIEIARQALEHIQQNFGNLESMNLQATTLSEAEALQGARFKIAKTDSEKMARWKEAIDNIQKNAEIARNIEDSFKEATVLTTTEASEAVRKMKASESTDVNTAAVELSKKSTVEPEQVLSKKRDMEEMEPAASEHKESKVPLDAIFLQAKDATMKSEDMKEENGATEKKIESHHSKQGKNTEVDTSLNGSLKEVAEIHEDAVKAVSLDQQPKVSEIIEDLAPAPSAPAMKAVLLSETEDHQKNALIDNQDKNILAKTNENTPVINEKKESTPNVEHEKAAVIDTTTLMKSVEHSPKQDLHADNLVLAQSHMMPTSEHKQGAKASIPEDAPIPPFIKSAENQAVVSEVQAPAQVFSDNTQMKSSKSEDSPLPPLFKSSDSDDALKPQITLKSTDGSHMTEVKPEGRKEAVEDADALPPFFRSAKTQAATSGLVQVMENHLDSTSKSETKSSEDAPLLPFLKSAEVKELDSEVKAPAQAMEHTSELKSTNSEDVDILFKSSDANHMAELKSSNLEDKEDKKMLFPPFFKSSEQQAPTAVLKSVEPEHQFKESDLHFQTQGKNWHEDKITSKAEDVELERSAHLGAQLPHHVGAPVHSMPHHHQQIGLHRHLGPHQHMMHHSQIFGKSVDTDSAAAPSTLVGSVASKDALERGPMMEWKEKEAARGAYGPGPYGAAAAAAVTADASGPGAVGVFPGAKVGGCAVPLLLSCSPSVVHGSLAPAPAYSAPHAYRFASDFNDHFHNKRDTKKTGITSKVQRTPTKVIQRIPLDKKL